MFSRRPCPPFARATLRRFKSPPSASSFPRPALCLLPSACRDKRLTLEPKAVFANDIETVIRDAVGSDYDSIAQKAVDELKYDGAGSPMKNTEGAARLIELIYAAGHRVSIIEDVVMKITALHHAGGRSSAGTEKIASTVS